MTLRERIASLEEQLAALRPVVGDTAGLEQYRDRPVEFAGEVLGVELWSKQREILNTLRDHSRVSVRAAHSVGKTFTAAAAALWFLYSRSGSIVVTTAPTARQVRELLWREIRRHHIRAGVLPGECLTVGLELAEKHYAIGLSTDEPDRFRGFHARDLLLIIDEASGVGEEIFTAARGILTTVGAKVLLIGNPTATSGTFYDSHTDKRHLWQPLHVSALGAPAFTGEAVSSELAAELVTSAWVEEMREDWGEDSPLFRSLVLGEFPDQAESALIALSWIEGAKERRPEATGRVELAADIARQGACENVVYLRQGSRILHWEAWRSADLMQTAGRIKALGQEWKAIVYRIDATGMGAGVADRLKEQGLPVEAVWVGERPTDPEKFVLRRDELWWQLREELREGRIGPLSDSRTQAQLSAIRYGFDSRGRIKVESKDEMSKRGLPSPDRADALALAFFSPAPLELATSDEAYQSFWNGGAAPRDPFSRQLGAGAEPGGWVLGRR